MPLTRRAFLRLSLTATLAALLARLPPVTARAAGAAVLSHTAGEFVA